MPIRDLADLTWEEARDLTDARPVAVLPVGALEAHGPHLPLRTDVIIAEAMARAGAARLASRGLEVLVLPPLPYTAAAFGHAFPGTLSVTPQTVATLVAELAAELGRHGAAVLALANAHLDPAHLAALHEAERQVRATGRLALAFPDLTRQPWALRLGEEFRSGACHAGRFESSVVLAARPDLVREEVRRTLPPNPRSLATAIREGKGSFEAADGPRAYFGWPADATADEGRETIAILGGILEEAVLAALASDTAA